MQKIIEIQLLEPLWNLIDLDNLKDNQKQNISHIVKKYTNHFIDLIVEDAKISSIIHIVDLIEISIVLTNDTHIQQLNKDYRNKNNATNVLSFSQYDLLNLNQNDYNIIQNMKELILGDIILSVNTIEKEACAQQKQISHHFLHLLLHGLLHLFGYDHIEPTEQIIMEKKEIAILATIGINNPYI